MSAKAPPLLPRLSRMCRPPSQDGGCRAVVLLSRQEQYRLHFQVPGRCPAAHRDLTVPSRSPDLLQTSTDLNFLWPCTDLGIAFSRDHSSKEFFWPQTSPLQQGLIQHRGRVWEPGISQGRAARNGHKRANSYSLVTQAEPSELL